MTNQQQQFFSIKCQCSAYKNDMLITSKKKSKLSNLILDGQSKTISIVPLNSKEENIIFQLKRLKHIHRKFIGQGKITLEFSQQSQKISNSIVTQSQENKIERLSQIFVEAASPQNLELLIKKIVDLKKSLKSESKSLLKKQNHLEKEHITEDEGKYIFKQTSSCALNKKKQNFPKPQKYIQNITERKRDPLRYSQKLKEYQEQKKSEVKFSRKQLMKQVNSANQDVQFPLKIVEPKSIFRSQVDILQLPLLLRQKIFEYTQVQLKHRLINKKFDTFILQTIKTLNFKDEVDTETFNKMAKYATNISGRLKNVRSLQLIDLYDKPQLQKNMAKSLYFGEWKQMSKKNMFQIKGLRIHTLQMPYQIKFDFSSIYGIKLKQLHLISKYQVTTANYLVKDDDIIYLFKHVKQLVSFSIPYINSTVLQELTTNKDTKYKLLQMKALKFESINQNCKKQQSWYLFHVYQQLKKLSVQRVLKGGIVRRDARYELTFPLYIEDLELGSFISQQTITSLPTTLTKLKLMGDRFYNKDIANIFLPYLRIFDLSECPLIRASVIDELQRCTNLKIVTNWQKQDLQFWKQIAKQKDIDILSIRGIIRK